MHDTQPKILPLGDQAAVVQFGNEISREVNLRSISLSEYLSANPFPGYVESIPAYASTTVFYDVIAVRDEFDSYATAFAALVDVLRSALAKISASEAQDRPTIEIPTIFDEKSGPDLESVAHVCGISSDEVIEIFTSSQYRVYMVGFLPGFAYMGEVDERLAVPRKPQPRQAVPKGSVGIAGRQTGIYPLESPGGWQLIGRTDVELFTPQKESPTLFHPGDQVRFVAV